LPQWLRPFASGNWVNRWTDAPFEMPVEHWLTGEWTVFMQGSQVIVAERTYEPTSSGVEQITQRP
jgi:hypothetical protein